MTCHHASMARERGTRLREKRAKWLTDEDIRNLYMWQPEPKYDFEQGMVLKLEEDGKHALKHAFRRNIQGLADASSTQGVYFRAMHDGNDILIWKQATVDIDGNPANHGWFMHYEEKHLVKSATVAGTSANIYMKMMKVMYDATSIMVVALLDGLVTVVKT